MNENTMLKANILGGMNEYILDVIGDDEVTDIWLREGLPDEVTEEELIEIAKCDGEWKRICGLFGELISGAV